MVDLSAFSDHDYSAVVIEDSLAENGKRLTTIMATLPRFCLPELATHRRLSLLSMNAASSRAIPAEKRVEMARYHPVVPLHFGKRQKGMQAAEELTGEKRDEAYSIWNDARQHAVRRAEDAIHCGGHKQWVSRMLEPYLWVTVLLTGTEWANAFHLRLDKAAQPEMAMFMWKVAEAYFGSTPRLLDYTEWHLPFVTDEERKDYRDPEFMYDGLLCKISAARCARLSYNNFDGGRDTGKDIDLAKRLFDSGHYSPAEHQGRSITFHDKMAHNATETDANFIGFCQYRSYLENQEVTDLKTLEEYRQRLEGWIDTAV